MDDNKKILQAILTGQNALKQDLSNQIKKLDVKIDRVEENLTKMIKKVDERVDMIGKQLAYLEDDAPTREEFDNLAGRVDKLEEKPPLAI